MPDYFFAFMSAILWAASAPIINHGLKKIEGDNSVPLILIGLFIAMIIGAMVLTPFVCYLDSPIEVNPYLIISGILTFPLATGAYYLSSRSFSKRAEFTSLFSKIKPLISFTLAILILKEDINQYSVYSAILVALGITALFIGIKLGELSPTGVILGILTALAWSAGEVLMAQGINDIHPMTATWIALLSAITISSIVIIPTIYKTPKHRINVKTLWPFIAHGGISFGAAYSLFFYSVDLIGLGHTVLINAFWPALAIFFTSLLRFNKGEAVNIPSTLLVSAFFLLVGSLFHAIFIL